MKICTHTNSIIDISVYNQIDILNNNNFDSVMLFWYQDIFDNSVDTFPDYIRNKGMEVENIHVPWYRIDELWKDSLEKEDVLKWNLQYIDDCKKHGISKMVIHPVGWQSKLQDLKYGIDSFKRLVEKAERNNVTIALENVAHSRITDELFKHINSNKLGFCYDNGHELINDEEIRLLDKYKNKVCSIHLTDNDGVDDLHLLPFDGKEDWVRVLSEIKDTRYDGPLSFEVGWQYRDTVKKYSNEKYISELRKRASRILEF